MPMGGVFYQKRNYLCVNINSIDTLREKRGENESDTVTGAVLCERAGCDGITVSLREDGPRIEERDVFALKDAIRVKFNLEMPLADELTDFAQKVKPTQVTIVSNGKKEIIREGGIDVRQHQQKIKDTVKRFHDQDILVSLLLEPDPETVERSLDCHADFIELHAGAYRNAADRTGAEQELNRIYRAAEIAAEGGMKVNVGHGLNYENILPVLDARGLVEVNIGHSIISRAASVGLYKAVDEMLEVLE